MAEATSLSKTSQVWEKRRIWECLVSGEKETVSWVTSSVSNETYFLSLCDGVAKCILLNNEGNAEITGKVEVEEDPVCSVTATSKGGLDEQLIVFTAHKSGLVRQWLGDTLNEPPTGPIAFKADHKGPILHLQVLQNNEKANELFTIGSDFLIKLWNIETHHCLSVLRGITSVPLCSEKYEDLKGGMCFLACGLVDGSVKIWRMKRDDELSCWTVPSSNVMANTLVKHHSQVPTLIFVPTSNGLLLVTCGRDQLIAIWDMASNLDAPTCTRLIPSNEEIGRVVHVSSKFIQSIGINLKSSGASKPLIESTDSSNSTSYIMTGGEKGKLRIWDVTAGKEINIQHGTCKFQEICPQNKISDLYVTSDENTFYLVQDDIISQIHIKSLMETSKCSVSLTSTCQHEVLDFLTLDEYLVVATTSSILKIYEFSKNYQGKLVCVSSDQRGHTDAILAISGVSSEKNNHFVTCSKDQSVCLWVIVKSETNITLKLIAKGMGHSSYVGAITATNHSIYSAAKDGVLKQWGWPSSNTTEDESDITTLSSKRNVAAHTLEINTLSCTPDEEHIATGSQDKLVKIWRASDIALVTTLSGHRRGIWCTKFFRDASSQQTYLVTASADSNVKLWGKTILGDFNCIHTLEGHLSSVLSVTVITSIAKGGGTKIASVSSDGLLKVWTSENNWNGDVGSFDAHDDKIWAVECVASEKIITGGRDGQMIMWENVTKLVREQERLKVEEAVKCDQRLNNYLINGKLSKALKLSLKMNKPRLTKKTLHTLQKRGELEHALQRLSIDERNILFQSLVQWNSYANQSSIVQDILKYLITDTLANGQAISADQCAGIIAYTEKHYQRLDKLKTRLHVVDLLLDTM